MRDRDNRTRTGAKDPWGREAGPLEQRHADARATRTPSRAAAPRRTCAKGRCKLGGDVGMPGAGLTALSRRQARSDRLALKPYWGKPAVRNFREGDGNVGIIEARSAPLLYPTKKGRTSDKERYVNQEPANRPFIRTIHPPHSLRTTSATTRRGRAASHRCGKRSIESVGAKRYDAGAALEAGVLPEPGGRPRFFPVPPVVPAALIGTTR